MSRFHVSLANKCQLLFGAAVLLIVCAALAVLWVRMASLVNDAQLERSRKLAEAYLDGRTGPGLDADGGEGSPLRWVPAERLPASAGSDPFITHALDRFDDADGPRDVLVREVSPDSEGLFRYARAVRDGDLKGDAVKPLDPAVVGQPVSQALLGLILIDEPTTWAERQLLLNRVYSIVAGLLAVLLAIAVFWLIATRLILSPVRVLRDTAAKVAEGDLNIRSDINTGDEFEQLSDTFNTMLTNLKGSQDKLRELNRQLDLKLGELAESNLSLFEANRVKGDFLANVSHELRTPLNSIVGFAEVLAESLTGPEAHPEDKRKRYVENILTSGKSLLQLITELLDLAKIEAGRVDLRIEKMSVTDTLEVLLNLIRPQADRNRVELALNVPRKLPVVETDAGKFQQVLFNFLANAVKFTPAGGRVELGAAAMTPVPDAEPTAVRIWVSDNGPGIAMEHHASIFEKFHQLGPTHTREHGGTGLGLAISRELARVLQGRIELDSDTGRGATFSLIIPLAIRQSQPEPLMPEAGVAARAV